MAIHKRKPSVIKLAAKPAQIDVAYANADGVATDDRKMRISYLCVGLIVGFFIGKDFYKHK